MKINPYLNFNGNCQTALDFYAKILGGKVAFSMTYGEAPADSQQGECSPTAKDKIMHARLEFDGNVIMASDCPPDWYQKPAGITVSLNLKDPKEAERIYAALSEKGEIRMPLGETFWAKKFAMFSDQFGTPWMINCEKEQY